MSAMAPFTEPRETLKIIVPGLPQGKGAARHTTRGFTYTPTKTRDYMKTIGQMARMSGAKPYDVPCSVTINAFFPIPDSYPNWKKEACLNKLYIYTKKPDTDNLSKIKDALTGIAFKDDALVFTESISKFYDRVPRLEITISYYKQWDGQKSRS